MARRNAQTHEERLLGADIFDVHEQAGKRQRRATPRIAKD
jgi:hypothetical protein